MEASRLNPLSFIPFTLYLFAGGFSRRRAIIYGVRRLIAAFWQVFQYRE